MEDFLIFTFDIIKLFLFKIITISNIDWSS